MKVGKMYRKEQQFLLAKIDACPSIVDATVRYRIQQDVRRIVSNSIIGLGLSLALVLTMGTVTGILAIRALQAQSDEGAFLGCTAALAGLLTLGAICVAVWVDRIFRAYVHEVDEILTAYA